MASGGLGSISGMNTGPTCNDRSANPASIFGVVGNDIPGFTLINISHRDPRICLLRLFSQHLGQSLM